MKRNFGDRLSLRIRSAFQRFDAEGLTRLLHTIDPAASLSQESLDNLAERLADPAWSRFAVRELDPTALAALRLLARLPHDVAARELDGCARLIAPQAEGAVPPSQQLLQAGIALSSPGGSVFLRNRETRLRVLGPLRERWLTLTTTSPEAGSVVPLVQEGEETFRIHRAEFELGVVLAAIEQHRPRATRFGDLHRGDAKAVVEKLAGLAGGEQEAQRLLGEVVARELVRENDGRLLLNEEELPEWRDPLVRFLHERMASRRSMAAWRAAFGELLRAGSWVSATTLYETAILGLLEHGAYAHDAARTAASTINDLARLAGVISKEAGDVTWFRLTDAAQRVLSGQPAGLVYRASLLVQPNLQIVAQPGVPLEVLAHLGAFCRLVSADAVAVFALDESTARRAAGEGWTASSILRLLEQHATHGVPLTVARAITDWARTRATATIATGMIALVELPGEEVRRLARPIRVDEVAPGVFRVDEEDGPSFISALRKGGIACRAYGATLEREQSLPVEDTGESPFFQEFTRQALEDVQRLHRTPND